MDTVIGIHVTSGYGRVDYDAREMSRVLIRRDAACIALVHLLN
jgi:hypothetical protein